MDRIYTTYEWNRLRYPALSLWKQGIRSGDRTIIQLQYGYSDHETDILCLILDGMEETANACLKDYNPDLGF